MGRRIPKTRKHKKLKFVDPCYTGPPRLTSKKKALPNEPPKEVNKQEVPNRMQELFEVKNNLKNEKFKKKRKKKKSIKDDFIIVRRDTVEDNQPGMTKAMKNIPETVQQGRNESEGQFFNRLQHMADRAFAEAKIEQKYDVDLIEVDDSGQAHFVPTDGAARTKKQEKRKKYKDLKKQKLKKGKEIVEEVRKDHVRFGEVVLQPPTFTAKPKKSVENKAGKRDLVLNKLLEKSTASSKPSLKKRKLNPEEQRLREAERLRVVNLYRSLKKNKSL